VRSAANPDVLEIVSSRAPKKRMDPTTEDGRGEIQRIVDNLESVFVADVAKYRGVAEDKVVSEFGQGGLVFAPDALAAGMVDAIGSYEETLAALARVTSGTRRVRSNNMTTENGGATDPVMYSQDQLNAAIATARTEESAKVSVAVVAERQRIAAVQKLSRPGFESITQKGVEDGTSAAEVALAIMTAAADRGITLEAIQKDSPKPAAHAAPNADDDKPKGKSWDAITGVKPQRM
jgi:ClpP class serine protease